MALPKNPRATFDYDLLERLDAGVSLLGHEVKALRNGHGTLTGAFIRARGGEAFLVGAQIPHYQAANLSGGMKEYDPERTRRLLLTKPEIARIAAAEDKDGLTCVPVAWYNAGRKVKLHIAIAKGKKARDKRADIKKRDDTREIRRTLKNQ